MSLQPTDHGRPLQITRPDGRTVEVQMWSDADLTRMSTVSQTDVQRAVSYWHKYLPPRLRGILNAIGARS